MWNRGGGGGADCRCNVVLHPFQRGHNGYDTGLRPVGEQKSKFHELAVGEVASRGKCQGIASRERFLGRKERSLLIYSLLALEILTVLPSEGLLSSPNACRTYSRMFRTYL